jgi:sec-independent protein translocase protein TatA
MLATILSPNVPLASLSNLFGPDALFIFLIILVFFGAKKLPELARSLGQAMREFSKAKDDFEHEITRTPTPEPEKPKQIEPAVTPAAPKTEGDQPVTAEQPKPAEHVDVTVHPPETVPKH